MIKRAIIIFFALLAIALIALTSLKYTSGDFDVYYHSSQNYLNKAPIYIPHGGINEFKYSPLFALLFSPLTFLNEYQALFIWTMANIIYLGGIFLLLYKLNQFSFTNVKDLLIIICLFALTGRFIFAEFRIGQVNILLCFLMILTMYFEMNKKHFWSSFVLAFSLMIKFFPLLFVLYFLLNKRFKLLAYTFLMVIFFLLVPAFYSGWDLNLQYLHDWFILLKTTPPVLLYSIKNNSLLSFFSWFFIARHEAYYIFDYDLIKKGLSPLVYLAWGSCCFFLFLSFFYDKIFTKSRDLNGLFLDYSCLFVCCLLFNPLSYLNSLVFLIVPYLFILRYIFYSQLDRKTFFLNILLILFSFTLTIIDNKVFFKESYRFHALMELKPLMWTIILVYVNLLYAKLTIKGKS